MPKFKFKVMDKAISLRKKVTRVLGRKNKYGAIPTTVDGIRFHSKKEAEYYQKLKLMQNHGHFTYFLRQVPYPLPGKIKYYADFVTFRKLSVSSDLNTNEYEIRVYDVKGKDTRVSINKRKQVEEIYNLKIEIV